MTRAAVAAFGVGCFALGSVVRPLLADSAVARAQARERIAYVSVVDAKTQTPLRELGPEGLVIREDGTRREILQVVPATSPMPVAVLVDNSAAAAPMISDLRKALASFLKSIDGIGPVALFTVAERPTVLQQYTSSSKELLDAAGRLFHAPSSGATLLDAISEVANGLAKRESDRAAMVVVTGEYVDYSNLQYRQVLDDLRDSGATLHAVVLVNPNGSMGSEEARNRATVLDRGTRESGGVRTDVLTSMSFEPRLKALGEILRSQFKVTFARPESLIPPEKFDVAATRPGLEAYGSLARGQGRKQ